MLEEQRTSAQTRGEFLLEQNSGLLGDLARLHATGRTAGMLDRYHAYMAQRRELFAALTRPATEPPCPPE
jgi:hypothetical protein